MSLIKKITAVLVVDEIESSLPFWRDQLRYGIKTEVPHGEKLGFVILSGGNTEVMLQTRASLKDDLPVFAEHFAHVTAILFSEVESLLDVEKSLKNIEVVVPRRKTFYGSEEIWVRDPAGNLMGFSQFPKP